GDLRGLISRLDYLHDLGVKALWLMPVTRSQDHDHGYAVADYRAVEADYGSLADLDALIAAAHARGLGVILDYVMNHSAAQHPLFVNAASGPANAWRDWYVWSASRPAGWSVFGADPWRASAAAGTSGGAASWYYAPFWDQMPDFNLRHPAVVEFHRDNLRFWLNRGVDGFRFDAVGMLFENGPAAWDSQPENDALMRDLATLVGRYQRRHLVCEAPARPDRLAAACGSAFAFGRQANFLGAARGVAADMRAVVDYPASHAATLASLLANHDSFAGARVWDQLQGDQAVYRLAAALYLLQPGTPYIYYGEEIGMSGGAGLGGDPALRSPMSWTATPAGFTSKVQPYRAAAANIATQNVAAQLGDASSLLAHYRALLALRNTRPSIARGDYAGAFVEGALLGFRRSLGGETTLVVLNTATTPGASTVTGLPAGAVLNELFPGQIAGQTADPQGRATISLPAQALRVFHVQP
ncbi:MAG: hypothetical protein RLY71_4663, partial [Pseudomonadota bacterium]